MSNLTPLGKNRPFRIPLPGLGGLHGWAVRCRSFEEDHESIKPGYWLFEFRVESGGKSAIIEFSPDLHMVYGEEQAAKDVVANLEANIEPKITLEVVRIP